MISARRPPGHGSSTGAQKTAGGIHSNDDERSRTPWGNARPDRGRREVRKYIGDYLFLWLKTYRCDGIRVGATGSVRHTNRDIGGEGEPGDGLSPLMGEINKEIRSRFPQKLLIAGDLRGDGSMARPLAGDGPAFDAQ